MSLLNLFKKVDKYIGTPLCYLLGLFAKDRLLPASDSLKNILIVKFIAMGDIIVLLPSIRSIRKQYPNARITLLTIPTMISLVQDSPDINEIIKFNIPQNVGILGFWRFIKKIRDFKFDIAIDFEQYYRLTGLIMWLAHIPHRVGFDISGQGRNTMLTTKVKYSDTLHEVENFGKLAEATGAIRPTQLIPPTFKSSPVDAQYIQGLLRAKNIENPIVIHPGTSATAKSRRWPAKNFAELADTLVIQGHQVVFTGAEEEKPIVEKILSHSTKIHTNLVGQTTLSQLLELFRQAQLVISLDTGPLHLAAGSGTPVLGLYGANTPIKWGPYGLQHKAIYHGPAVPCTQQQYGRVCKHPEGYHMRDITVQEVLNTALSMLEK